MKVHCENKDVIGVFPPASCSSAFQKLQRTLCQVSLDCRHSDRVRQVRFTGAEKCHRPTVCRECITFSSPSDGHPARCRESRDTSRRGVNSLVAQTLLMAAPMCDIMRMQKYNWIQLSGHDDTLSLAGPGTLWKKVDDRDSVESNAYQGIMADEVVRCFVPRYHGQVFHNDETFIEIDDLLFGFEDACVMDIKMGTRTFLENEVTKSTPRTDLYAKMVAIDSNAVTAEERSMQAVTKLRYMTFREESSSTGKLGFRIEGLKIANHAAVKQLRYLATQSDVRYALSLFVRSNTVCISLLEQLYRLRTAFENSRFFREHEVVGSSILLVHDKKRSGAWMIDFAKTLPLPPDVKVTHRSAWALGNKEDGYLTGLDNLIKVLEELNVRFSGSRSAQSS